MSDMFDESLINYINNKNNKTLLNLLSSKNIRDSIDNLFKSLKYNKNDKIKDDLIYFIIDNTNNDKYKFVQHIIYSINFKYQYNSNLLNNKNAINIYHLQLLINSEHYDENFIKNVYDKYYHNLNFQAPNSFYYIFNSKYITDRIIYLLLPHYCKMDINIDKLDLYNAHNKDFLNLFISYYKIDNIDNIINKLNINKI